MYRLVRVNDDRHPTHERAMNDMRTIIVTGFYWTRRESPPVFPRDTHVIGIGSYGGRGLFLHGVVDGEWFELEADDAPYRYKLPVVWDQTIYEGEFDAVLDGLSYPRRAWSSSGQHAYTTLLRRLFDCSRTTVQPTS